MRNTYVLAALAGSALVILLPFQSFTNSKGAPSNKSAAPTPAGNSDTCATNGCHDTYALNSGTGMLSIITPDQYEPGDTVDITIHIEQTDAGRFGFQATVRGVNDLMQSTGTILLVEGTKFSDALGEYITHSEAIRNSGSAEWTFKWVAPAEERQSIVIYAASVAGNDNNNRAGDRVYTNSAMVPVSVSVEDELVPASFELYSAYPNPFRQATTISYSLSHAEPVQFALYDALGRLVKTLDRGLQPAGVHEILISGDELPAGTYYYRINTPSNQKSHTLTRIR